MKSIKEIAQIVLTKYEEELRKEKYNFLCNVTDDSKLLTKKEKKYFTKVICETFSCYYPGDTTSSRSVWAFEETEERKSFLNSIILGEEFYEPKNHNTIYYPGEKFKIAY